MAGLTAATNVVSFPGTTAPGSVDDSRNVGSSIPPLTRLKRQYEDYVGAKFGENAEAAMARRYYAGKQWTAAELQELKRRKQPPVTLNRVAKKINGIVGLIEKLRQDPRAYPRSPQIQAEMGAELATVTLNQALDESQFREKVPEVGRMLATVGISGVEMVIVPGDRGDPTIDHRVVDMRDFFYDPRSGQSDFDDTRYHGTSKWVDLDVAQDMWPDSAEELKGYVETAPPASWHHGDARDVRWVDVRDKRVRLVDHWYVRQERWFYVIYAGDVILEDGPSPFYDHKRRSVSKYIMASCYIDEENDRYALCRDFKSSQDEINHRRSKGVFALNTRRITAEKGAFDDPELARREAARQDGYIERNPGYEAEIVTNDFDFKGNLEMLAEAKAEIDNFGPTQNLIDAQIDTRSGRALALLQQAGIAELGPFMVAYRAWKLRVYRLTWCAIQQFWTADRWLRVTDDEGLTQFVQINGWERDEYGFPVAVNQLAALDVDIILDEGPDQVNTMADAFDTLIALAQNGSNVPPQVIIELSTLPASVKKKVLTQLAQAAQPDPITQQATQIKMAQEGAKVGKIQSETQRNLAQAQAAVTPDPGGQQVDTPADLAKAAKDMAQAKQIETETMTGAKTAPPPPPPKPIDPITAALNAAKAREAHARADKMELETAVPGIFERAKAQAQAANRPPRPTP